MVNFLRVDVTGQKSDFNSMFQSCKNQSVGFDESLEHCRDFVLVGKVVLDDDPGRQALEGGELEGVDLRVRIHPQEVDRTLEDGVASVDVGAVFEKDFDNLKKKKYFF